MKSTHTVSLLAAAALSVAVASQAHAAVAFNYDLRLAPGQQGATDAHNVVLDATSPTTYTLQLWGQISGDTNLGNDGWISGFVSEKSVQSSNPAFTTGGISGVALGALVNNVSNTGASNANITPDGITDWGSQFTTATTGYTLWRAGASTPVLDSAGTVNGQSQAVNANTWEVLLVTYTLTVGGVDLSGIPTLTSIQSLIPPQVKSGAATVNTLAYTVDGGTTAGAFTIGSGVNFTSVPEPTSLGLLALGGLALANRRRKA